MLLHRYFLDDLVQQRQAAFEAEAAHQMKVAEALRARDVRVAEPVRRQIRIVRTPTWSSHQRLELSRETSV